jgi:hypothetical protein
MKTKFILAFSFLLLLCFYDSVAQETTFATGGNIPGAGGSISYTVGQVVNLYLSEKSESVAQGVQKPYEIFVIMGVA